MDTVAVDAAGPYHFDFLSSVVLKGWKYVNMSQVRSECPFWSSVGLLLN
jgi:hypothetical protein